MSLSQETIGEIMLAMRMLLAASVGPKVNHAVCKAAAEAVTILITGSIVSDFDPVTTEIARLAAGGKSPEQIVEELSRRMTETYSEYHRQLLKNLCCGPSQSIVG